MGKKDKVKGPTQSPKAGPMTAIISHCSSADLKTQNSGGCKWQLWWTTDTRKHSAHSMWPHYSHCVSIPFLNHSFQLYPQINQQLTKTEEGLGFILWIIKAKQNLNNQTSKREPTLPLDKTKVLGSIYMIRTVGVVGNDE